MFRPGTNLRALGFGLAAATVLLGTSRQLLADDTVKARWSVTPYLDGRASGGGQTVDLGVEAFPAIANFGWRVSATVRKADPDKPVAEASTETFGFGAKLQLLSEFGRGMQSGSPTFSDAAASTSGVQGPSRVGLGVVGSWTLASYNFQPDAGETQTTTEHTWKLELRSWWFRALSDPVLVGSTPGEAVSGSRPPVLATDYRAWLGQPQFRMSYERAAKEASDSYVVQPPNAEGLELAKKVKLAPPSLVPTAVLLVAFPLQPDTGRFGFGPAARFTFTGGEGRYDPFSGSSRMRLEFWGYYFAFSEGPAVRLGVAPFVDILLSGADKRDDVVGGAVVELRTSTSRLEY